MKRHNYKKHPWIRACFLALACTSLATLAQAAPADASTSHEVPAAEIVRPAGDFLSGSTAEEQQARFDPWRPFSDQAVIPLDQWVTSGLNWVVAHFRPAFQAIRVPVDQTLSNLDLALQAVPPPIMLLLIGVLAWRANGYPLAVGAVASFVLIGLIGAWSEAMVTLSLVLTSLLFCIVVGVPLGIACARSDRLQGLVRPILDAMQTTPAFVYLVPVVMLFGIGNVPGVLVTIIFALAPLVRLTNLGIRQVRPDLIEASRSFGASPWQILLKVQVPLAMPTIMAGVNQALMMSLSMVVIASMIAVGGLGQMVLRGIGRLDLGLAAVGGVGIVLMAIVLDRMTQSLGHASRLSNKSSVVHNRKGWLQKQ
ncbi:glycine betaine/L-proline ABC transporter permease ProW [Pseudomonas sp. S 311-6]|uniref:glycine betaine/L-proline ABC transporter permease ProW n=1 Tax=Pseudomonas TaxID=286 RepID=UPI00209696DF|nr:MULTISPECIES: glycine betaine/L-proline ABC transporter permease ProW [Pseudomonas]MCO7568207.1 glycine betaine/L-proline ABC transporter permease ProW [Pseudomonas mosselii]MCO7619880.1 glycine betaine/L-proline ABC transporter permease ProW [Pseudomonas guariconensis]MCO7643615.1 glycine betaine/L-proline ABC transporter permease ProW [Pseudomonas sp. S 311-6]